MLKLQPLPLLLLLVTLTTSNYAMAETYNPNKTKLRQLAGSICAAYGSSGNKIKSEVKGLVTSYMKRNAHYKTTTNKQIIQFLNQHKDYMVCGLERKNYMKVAFDQGRHQELFRGLFISSLYDRKNDKNTFIDINAVSYTTQGKPETVLDYIESVIADSTNSKTMIMHAKSIKRMFSKHFGAKHFTDLPKDVQQRYLNKQ